MFSVGIVTERLESGQDDKHSSPTMIEREWKMDKEFVGSTLGFVILFDNVIDVLKREVVLKPLDTLQKRKYCSL